MAVKVKWTGNAANLPKERKNDTTPTVRYVGMGPGGNTYQPYLETENTTGAGTVKSTVKNDQQGKFNVGQYAGDAGKLFINGIAEGLAATGASVENLIGKGLDKLFPGAGFEGSGLFNALYNGRPDWKWAGENGLVGIKQDREYNQESLQQNADNISSKILKKAAEFGGDIAYGLGNAAPMAAEAMATGGASMAANLTKEGLLKTGAEVVEKTGVLNTLSKATRDLLTSKDYWTSFASEVGMDYYDAKDNGATEDEALRYALYSAGLNSVIEIGGGIQKIPERPNFKTWLKSANEEGMEEVQQGIVSRLLENAVYNKGNPIVSVTDDNAVINPVNALGEYAGGAAVGGILSGGQQLTQRAINRSVRAEQNKQAKKVYGDSAQDLVAESLELNPNNELATRLQDKLDNGEQLTGNELRQLVEQNENSMVASDKASIQSAVENRLSELGAANNVSKMAEIITQQISGEDVADSDRQLVENSKAGRQVRQELNPENIRVGAENEAWTGNIGTARINTTAYNRDMQKTGVTGAKYNAETGKLDAIVTNEAGEVKTVPAAETEMTPMQEELFDWADELKLEAAGPLMVRAYQPEQNMELYTRSFKLAYEYGKAGMPMDYVEKSEGVNYLHPTQIKLAYEEGRAATQRKVQAREEKMRSGGTMDSATKKKGSVSLRGATVGGKTYAPVNRKTVDSRQWASVKAMRAFSRAVGVDVVFYQSQANERGVYEGANGFYKDGKLYLDINAGRDTVGMTETAVLKTAAHELTHFIQANSAQYEALKSFVVNKLTHEEGVSFEDLVADKQRREPGLEYDEAVDEVVADACEMMLGNSTVVEQLAKENRSLAEKIRDWLREWVENLKIALEGLQADRTESRAMMQYAQELQEIWDNALMDAARNNRGTAEKTAPAESRRQVRENFSNEIDSWAKDGMPEGVRFTLGSTGPVLQGLGAIESDIYMEGDKIQKILQDHPEMMLAEIKKVPQILEDPALVLKSKTRTNSLVVLGTYRAQNGKPILAAMDLLPRGKGFVVDGMQKVTSAYTKTESQTATAEQVGRKFLMGSDVLFADKKRTAAVLRPMGISAPIDLLRNGYIGSISYKKGFVNIQGAPFSSVVKMDAEEKTKFSMRDSAGRELTEAQQAYFKDSKVRDADGNLLVMYHQTDGTFTVFDTKHKGAGAGDDETPFGIFLKRTSRNIGVRGEKQMELYADIRNPLRVRDRTELVSKLRELSVDYARLKDESAQIDKEYGAKFEEAKNAFNSFLIQWRKNNPDAPPRAAYDADGFDAAFNEEDNVVKEWTRAKDELALRAKTSITQALRDNGYDGVILENDKGSWGRSTDAYIALDANQVKNTTNKTPTADPDIRYQQRDNLKEEYHLTDDEESAIISYKSGDSYTLNGKLTARAELTEYQRKLRDNLDAALEKLPVYRGEVYRHYNFDDFGGFEAMRDFLSLFKNGRHIELGGYLSCSIMCNEDRTKGKYTVNMVIQSENGRRLAGFGRNTEIEILLPRNTRLVPYRMERVGPTSIRIYVREETISETGKANDSTLPGVLQVREGTQRGKDLQQVSGGDSGKVQREMGRFAGRDGDRGGVPGLREGEGSGALDSSGVAENYGRTGTRGGEGEGVKNQQRELRLSDRAVLLWAAEKAMRERSKRWSIEDINRFDILVKKLKGLDDAYAELEALKEERTVQLAGRKESELKNEERFELSQTKNRIQTQKDKIQRLEADTYRIESIPQMKELLRKSRSIVEAEAAYKARAEFREAREKQEMLDVTRRKVERNAKRLLEYMNTNTDKKHIPEALKKPIGELLESLDFYSNSARKGGNKTRADQRYCEAMQGLQSALAAQKLFDDTGEGADLFKGYLDLPAGFESMLGVHVERVKTAMEKHPLKTDIVRKMDLDDLRDLDVILSVMSRSVTKMNEMFVNRRFAYVADAAEDSIESMDRLGQHQDKAKGAEQFALWDNTLPWYAFQRFGEGGKAVFEGLQDGWDKLAFNMKTVLDFRQELIKDTVARKWDTETHKVELTDPDGETVTATLTTAQLMSLYCLSKRKQALGHLLGGGIRPAAIELTDTLGDRVRKRSLTQDKQYKLTDESLGQLLKLLTPEQKKIADAMQKFMTEQGSAWGNAVTMARFGYRGFTEQNYFPIETDAQDRQAKTGDTKEGSLYRLQNISAVKPLVKNANNALILRGIFDVFANHTADMAKYNAMVLPIIDAQKWYNYKYASKNEAGQVSTRTVQRAMTRAYGGAANSFVIKYMQDLNGVKESGDRGDTLPKKMISNYKRAMVAANMRVALLQPTAYVRASAVLDYKYLVKAFADKTGTKQATKEMLENSGIALWKSLGFFDTDVGRSVRDQIKGKSGKLENLVDKTMIPAEKGDEITWARLWRACKLEVQDKQSLTGDELLKATAERFREVVYRTQVVDSTMTRSHMMRGSGTLSKMTTSFMSEPTVSYNMVMESTRQIAEDAKRLGMRVAIRRNWKVAGRAYQAYIVSAVVTAIVESIYDALRDSDDDDYLDKVWKAFGGEKPETVKDGILNVIFGLNGNLAGDINPIGKVPYLRDVVSILGGYSNGRMDTEAVANLKKAVDIWDEVIRLQTGDLDKATKTTYYGNMTTYGMIYPTAKALSQLTGLPGSAAMREIVTVWNSTVGAAWPNLKRRTYENKQLREAWEKYGKASGVSYAVMYRATQDTKDFKSDKDADGNTISGSLKAKYVEYIRSLGLPRAQEKAVWEAAKVSSWSDKGTPWG